MSSGPEYRGAWLCRGTSEVSWAGVKGHVGDANNDGQLEGSQIIEDPEIKRVLRWSGFCSN